MQFHSILFDWPEGAGTCEREAPACFPDLHLDQALASIVAGREEYDLKPFFYTPLQDSVAVRYRHDILHDLENEAVFTGVMEFAQRMRRMRQHRAQAEKLHNHFQTEFWFLDAVAIYCDAVGALTETLARLEVRSHGFQAFREYLATYRASDVFLSRAAETQARRDDLARVQYCVRIQGNRVTVSAYAGEADYSADVEETFAKFKQGAVTDHRVKFSDWPEMNHVEAQVLELVARLVPEVFQALDDYCAHHAGYLDETVGAFDREIQFYLAYLEFMRRFKAVGLPFCYPQVSTQSKHVMAQDTFDLALATTLVTSGSPVVRNDFFLQDPERVFVVTGPNQGGKSTFARMFGQVSYLASLGLPVPGSDARLFLADRIYTHFEREEDLTTLRGKLEDELIRIHDILEQATSGSVIIMNESFASTTLHDARFLGEQVLRQIIALGALCVYVTFVDELASLGDSVVSMVSTVLPENPAVRTYKIVRQPADGLAYAAAIAETYGLTYESLSRRIAQRSIEDSPRRSVAG